MADLQPTPAPKKPDPATLRPPVPAGEGDAPVNESASPHAAARDEAAVDLEIVRLPVGEIAPVDTDCIILTPRPGGAWNLAGNALDDETSVSIVDGPDYETKDAAEAAGCAWAAGHGVTTLHIVTLED